ncbi:hypothetical protein KSP35_12505 [Aquihabitans sp. G128]|uniref:GNAT family N-acetyltransferase n=1 Tax=Aquihabitans sp. G128 TaxID=2849779 RepID=UPI001C21DC9E|nr:GNAT family N-acetyltransferase [Aquihabitans sp. G128]QXC59229.1 hypothetical protein KSP35_12505 [Aquihabitans sp. G128]
MTVRLPIGSGRWLRLGRHPELEGIAADGEPRTLPVSSALRAPRRPGTLLVACVEGGGGRLLGALAVERSGVGRWDALPLLLDVEAAPWIARLAQVSGATRVYGTAEHVDPVADRLTRVERVVRLPFHSSMAIDGLPPVDPRTRRAVPADAPALADLFASYGLSHLPSRRSRRRHFERVARDRLAVVVELDGEVVGAAFGDAAGRDHVFLADGTIRPDHRGQGLSWPMVLAFVVLARDEGLAVCGSPVASNPMDPVAHADAAGRPVDEWVSVRLRPRLPEPAQRLRTRAVRALDRRLERRRR